MSFLAAFHDKDRINHHGKRRSHMLRQTIFHGQLAKLTSIAQNKSMSLNNNARLLLTKVGNDLSAMSSNGRSKHDVCIR
ncbi:MAG TPA: hypothetical protein VFI70_02505 [Nitrososphaeraceae archaeon]|nr:hypothetical protein [Nitrososphaeraceae archaeon]